jgi:hypothetical protein
MRENQQLFLGLRLVSRIFEENQQSAIQTKIEKHFGGFFECISTDQPDKDQCSKHQRSADQRLSTSTNKMPSKNALQINGSLHQPLLI